MPLNACKAIFQVTAGVVSGIGIGEYTKRWNYMIDDFEKDKEMPQDQPTIFSRYVDEAHDYAKGLSNPAHLNWVHVDWMWL